MLHGRAPFARLGRREWLNLAMAALAAGYLVDVVWTFTNAGLFDTIGMDFRAYRASAEIIRSGGFAQVYDMPLQAQVQRVIYDAYAGPGWRAPYETIPMPYLPPFAAPFQLLLAFDPAASFAVFTVLNAAVMALSLLRYSRALALRLPLGLSIAAFLSLPVFANLFFGQVSVWLLICAAESYICLTRRQGFRGGIWLAGLLLKPQMLVLILPGLLVGRRTAALGGFCMGALAVGALSVVMAGPDALGDLLNLVLFQAGGPASVGPVYMVNWRALGANLSQIMPEAAAWAMAAAGMLATAGVGLSLWRAPLAGVTEDMESARLALVLLGTYAATCAVTWHSHQQMSIPVVIFVVLLAAKSRLPLDLAKAWLFGPGLVWLLAIPAAAIVALFSGVEVPGLAMRLSGLGVLTANVVLVFWAARALRLPPPAAVAE